MSNIHLRDKNLSLKATGLLSVILSLPEDWNYSLAGLVAICAESESAVKTALNELKKNGYLKIVKKMPNETPSGRIEYEYNIYKIKNNSHNVYSYIFSYTILTYLGFDIYDVLKKC